jgi:endogenous inhibitor of DNA gyrase (YacG/DUF329 family)
LFAAERLACSAAVLLSAEPHGCSAAVLRDAGSEPEPAMSLVRCPTCSQQFDPQKSTTMPFCSERCRRIDLRRWLNEDISMPYRELPDDGSRDREPREEDRE